MAGEIHDDKKSDVSHLNYVYSKYIDVILGFENHIHNLYDNWVIDIDERNNNLSQLNSIVQELNISYNELSAELDNNNEPINAKLIDTISMINYLEKTVDDPFIDIRNKIIKLARKNGYCNINDFLKFRIGSKYQYLLDSETKDLINLYSHVAIPYNISVCKNKDNVQSSFQRKYIEAVFDGQIDNTCKIVLVIRDTCFTFKCYVIADSLNVYSRCSNVYSKYISDIKESTKKLVIDREQQFNINFLNKYIRSINCNRYFVYDAEELATIIIDDFSTYDKVINQNVNSIMKKFVKADIKTMYNTINLLLMGNKQNAYTANLLFNLLKYKKLGGTSIGDIIFYNMSFRHQRKIRKASKNIKAEIARLQALNVENVSLEKRLASQVYMPDNAKTYIMEKSVDLKNGENCYKIQMAINGLFSFPWKTPDCDSEFQAIRKSASLTRNYIQRIANNLDNAVYGHDVSKKIMIDLFGKWIQNPGSSGQIIGLVGPAGTGKTLFAKSLADAMGIPLSVISLGGMYDSCDLVGHSFTYTGSQYGMILRQIIKAGKWRSIMLFDEVDKTAKRNDTNEIFNTLIHITDPNMNQNFQDRFFSSSIEFDLSGVLFIFSYNDSSKINPILLDRIKEVKISRYSTSEKIKIAQEFMLKDLCSSVGFDRNKINFSNETIKYIIEKYTLEAGVRELKRKLEHILLKLNIDRIYLRGPFETIMKKYANKKKVKKTKKKHVSKTILQDYLSGETSVYENMIDDETRDKIFSMDIDDIINIDIDLVHKYLEKPNMNIEKVSDKNSIGVINGLYATSMGTGGIIPIQIYKSFTGKPNSASGINLKLTGNQLKVMKESVSCALTAAVNILGEKYKDSIYDLFPYGFHVHAPDGNTPKDGPSAGCAFATAFVSAIIGKKISRTVAMTGEIDLTGKVSRIGGLDAKLNGAKKAGVNTVFICEENREDYEKILKKSPEMFDDTFDIVIINHLIDIVTNPLVIPGVKKSCFDKNILLENKKRLVY